MEGITEKLYFAGHFGADAERMNPATHQVTCRIINDAVTGYGTFTGKYLCNNL